MARSPSWKGYLKLSLVTARVSLEAASSQARKIRFHVINRDTGNRVQARYFDSVTHRAVSQQNQVMGFPKQESKEENVDEFVLLSDAEIDTVALESTHTINVETFVPRDSVDWIWFDKAHFLKPVDTMSEEAYGVILQSMADENVLGIARLVLNGRERAVALEPRGKGIVLWTLHFGETVKEPVASLEDLPEPGRKLTSELAHAIRQKRAKWRPSLVKDPLQTEIARLIEDHKPEPPKQRGQEKLNHGGLVIDITEALRKSLRKS